MNTDALLNDFATRCFRDVADHDYITARMCYRAHLLPQFHWSGLQALEKYLKAILLYNRVSAKDVKHDLGRALQHAEKLPFQIRMTETTREMINHLDTFGRFRYLEGSWFVEGPKLVQLDKAVWEVRRYCRVLNYNSRTTGDNMLAAELAAIEAAEQHAPQTFRIPDGKLEMILKRKKDPARAPLLWQNGFFGTRSRGRVVRMPILFSAENAPLTLHPELLDEVLRYVYLPKEVETAYRQELKRRAESAVQKQS
jgi:hypothetical protein